MTLGCSVADTYFAYSDAHLWAIVAEGKVDPNQVIILHFSSEKHYSDKTVQLVARDHPSFITVPTVIAYYRSKITTKTEIIEQAKYGEIQFRKKLSAGILTKIRDGILKSPQTPNDVKDFYSKSIIIQA